MERKKASDFHPELLSLFDRYIHGGISRREFRGALLDEPFQVLHPEPRLARQVPFLGQCRGQLPRLDVQAQPRPDKRDRSPFGAPPRSCAGNPTRPGPRFLESPDANGRTLSGASAASTSQSGTRRTG